MLNINNVNILQACVRVNFGPSFIMKPNELYGALALSEVQPLNNIARKVSFKLFLQQQQ